ncbi:O-antigen ligase [Lewinella sp. JB7]|uniref:O-antigen ligase family protein n=1 Tax=Lewinella sp. JB7 TaxID=2962887 RepID=UPI0020C9D180|nr:O-antigen ligase family protein [Lewinella sp. JB7]MCP9235511.1 O-antigen ligase family protein [Lewinella sp. JB7]
MRTDSEGIWRRKILSVTLAACFVGMVFSPVVLSLGIICTSAALVLGGDRGLNAQWKRYLPCMLRSSVFWGMTGLYLLLVVGIPQTEDWPYMLERLRVKLPLLILPLAWAPVAFYPDPPITFDRAARRVLVGFVSIVLLGVLINYGLHFTEINELIGRGKPMPVPRDNHIRFSLLVALGGILGLEGFFRYRDRLLLGLSIFLLAGLHLLAVRTGLATAYAGCGVVLAWTSVLRGNYRYLVYGLGVAVCIPLVAYLTVPTFRTKFNYMRYELLHRDPNKDSFEYSDEGRWTSIELGLEVWREHPVVGVGPGNLRAEMDRKYAQVLPETPGKRPHNQFVSALAGSGAFGLLVTVSCFALLGFGDGRWRDPAYFAVFTVFLLSCLVENTLESSVGVSLLTLMLLLLAYPPWRKPG